jgi:hypothetical protein
MVLRARVITRLPRGCVNMLALDKNNNNRETSGRKFAESHSRMTVSLSRLSTYVRVVV